MMKLYYSMHSLLLLCICSSDISVGLSERAYTFKERDGIQTIFLELNGPLECCSVSMTIKVEDITAEGKHLAMYTHTYIYICICRLTLYICMYKYIFDYKYDCLYF